MPIYSFINNSNQPAINTVLSTLSRSVCRKFYWFIDISIFEVLRFLEISASKGTRIQK